MKKTLCLIMAMIMVFAFATTVYAYSAYTTIGANSSSSARAKTNLARSYSSWSASNGSFGGDSSKKLTVRPYQYNTSTRVSSAYTYSLSNKSGGQSYDILVSAVDVYANSNGGGASLTADWKF